MTAAASRGGRIQTWGWTSEPQVLCKQRQWVSSFSPSQKSQVLMSIKLTLNCREPEGFAKIFVAPVQPKRCFSSGVGEDYTKGEHPSLTSGMLYVGAWTRCGWMWLFNSDLLPMQMSLLLFPELLWDGPAASRGMGHLMDPGCLCKTISFWWQSSHLDFSWLCGKWVDTPCCGDKAKFPWFSSMRPSVEWYLPSWDQACSGCHLPSLWAAAHSAVQLGRNLFQGGGRGKLEFVLNPPRGWVACRQLAFLTAPCSAVRLAPWSSQDATYCPTSTASKFHTSEIKENWKIKSKCVFLSLCFLMGTCCGPVTSPNFQENTYLSPQKGSQGTNSNFSVTLQALKDS